jgi:hypothetical protein
VTTTTRRPLLGERAAHELQDATDVAYHNHVKTCALQLRCMPLGKQVFARLRDAVYGPRQHSHHTTIVVRTEPDQRMRVNLLTGETMRAH